MSSKPPSARFLPAGDTAIVVEFGHEVSRPVSDMVLSLADSLAGASLPGVVELVPTFRSLMVHYDPLLTSYEILESAIRLQLSNTGFSIREHRPRLFSIPVAYGDEHGPDLNEVAERTQMTPGDVIRLHTSVMYHVYSIGFLPGYPYMGDGPAELSLPRRESPRLRVPMGSVCIAFRQAGIYSLESPGGWHLLGRTPVRLFDTRRENPVMLAPGDKVRFEPVSTLEFSSLDDDAAAGTLEIRPIEVGP